MDDIFDINLRIDGSFKPKNEAERLYNELLNLSDIYFEKYIQDTDSYDFADEYFEPCSLNDPDEVICDPNKIRPFILRKEIWEFYSLFRKLILQSEIDNFYWRYCSFNVYKGHLERRMADYINDHINSNVRDFLINELIDICEPNKEYCKLIKSLKYDFTKFDLLPTKIVIEGNVFPETKFNSENNSLFQELNEITQKRKIEYILELLVKDYPLIKIVSEIITDRNEQEIQPENPFPRIFKDYKSYQLFKHLQDSVNERTILVDYSFIYWSLSRDNFIYSAVRPTEFINFLNDSFQIALSDLKQYENCLAGKRTANYQTAKLLFK